jgi:hypothetical protein
MTETTALDTEMPRPQQNAISVVATVGLHGSASTWVFNVVREILASNDGEGRRLNALYADRTTDLPVEFCRSDRLLIKSHQGSAELDAWLRQYRARIVLSIRDPRDAALSMTQRFDVPLSNAIFWLIADCNRILRLLPENHLMLRYEDRFFDNQASIIQVGQWLGCDIRPEEATQIFDRYRTDAVRSFAARIGELPANRIAMVGKFPMDRITQILAPHIGNAQSGKWLDLPQQRQEELTRLFRPFLERFGYVD